MSGIGARVELSISLCPDLGEASPAPTWAGAPPIGPEGMPARVTRRPTRLTEVVDPADMTGVEVDASLRDV